jgi:hypothetical protein
MKNGKWQITSKGALVIIKINLYLDSHRAQNTFCSYADKALSNSNSIHRSKKCFSDSTSGDGLMIFIWSAGALFLTLARDGAAPDFSKLNSSALLQSI